MASLLRHRSVPALVHPTWLSCHKIYGVARGTVRRAVLELRTDGVVVVSRGLGTFVARERGSHRVYVHPDKPGIAVVPGKLSKDLPLGYGAS